MANLFDAANAPEGEPTEIVVGDFLQWKRSDVAQDYPTGSGYRRVRCSHHGWWG